MARLTRADMEAALAFAAEVGTAASQPERADSLILEQLASLIHADLSGYISFDASCQPLHATEFPGLWWVPTERELELFSTQNPFSHYGDRTGQPHFLTCRLTDVVDVREFHRTEMHAISTDQGIPHAIQTRMPAESGGHWTLGFERGGRNFSDRDLLIVDTVRPSLIAYEAHRALAAKVAELQGLRRDAVPDELLSVRENEVLDLVAKGASNAEIAERLWISPATVKKHLENVYAKLAVRSRTAALAQTGRSLPATDAPAAPH
jgi:DNA-binding CsgD family transcriptional regulator